MEYVYAAMLLHSAGKEINETNVEKVLNAAGVDVDKARIKALTAALEDVNIEEAISKAVSFAAPAPSGGAPAPAEGAGKAKDEEKEEEAEEEEVSEEEAAAGLGALFG